MAKPRPSGEKGISGLVTRVPKTCGICKLCMRAQELKPDYNASKGCSFCARMREVWSRMSDLDKINSLESTSPEPAPIKQPAFAPTFRPRRILEDAVL